MTREGFLILVVTVTVLIFVGMWFGWRGRSKRDSNILTSPTAPQGERIARFDQLMYVSSTPSAEPLTRLAIPGLRYRGRATLEIRTDGIAVTVVGERPVYLAATDVTGVSFASIRIGKAVENDGLILVNWVSSGREIESCFRAKNQQEQHEITAAVNQMLVNTNVSSKGNE